MAEQPRLVILPDGITVEQASQAIVTCTALGLIQRNQSGYLVVPSGLSSRFGPTGTRLTSDERAKMDRPNGT